jgi:C4-dicarboxylate-specific signal transduction histidine kinase
MMLNCVSSAKVRESVPLAAALSGVIIAFAVAIFVWHSHIAGAEFAVFGGLAVSQVIFSIVLLNVHMAAKRARFMEACEKERARLEADAQAKMVSESRIAALGEMATGISHEINNPLTILKGYLFVLGDQLKSQDITRDKMQEVVRRATLTTDRMAVIVKCLHEYTHEKIGDEIQSVNLKTTFDRDMTFCRERLVAFGIGLVVDSWPVELSVMGRSPDLVQVIMSLFINAADAIQPMDTRWIRVSVREEGDRVIFRIQDSGPGIPERIALRMFDPFFTTKVPGSGVGLGLSVARTLMLSQGGDLRYVAGEPHTTFELEMAKAVT